MKPARRVARRALLSLGLLCLALPALPQSPGYLIELVVFRNGSDAGALSGDTARPVFSADDVGATPATSRKLGGAATRLGRNGLRVIGQAAWHQNPTPWRRETPVNLRRGVSAAAIGLRGVSGKVIFERGEYLHLGVDLLVEDGGRRYHIRELRSQVKTDDIQYFDHPAIGVLAVITRD